MSFGSQKHESESEEEGHTWCCHVSVRGLFPKVQERERESGDRIVEMTFFNFQNTTINGVLGVEFEKINRSYQKQFLLVLESGEGKQQESLPGIVTKRGLSDSLQNQV